MFRRRALVAATVPRWLWSCGAEPSGECAEDGAIGACRGQKDSDAGGPLHDARSDLDQAKAHCGELCIGQLRACGYRVAHGEHEPVGGGVQDQAELVGFGIAAGGAVGSELALVQLVCPSSEFLRHAAAEIKRVSGSSGF